MLLVNVDASLVNGTVGTVIGFAQTCASEMVTVVGSVHRRRQWPLVRFETPSGMRRALVGAHTWTEDVFVLNDNGRTYTKKVLASYQQVPLKLGWAMTIHKSQGLEFDQVHVDLANCWAGGMAYVALSRAKTERGLSIKRFTLGSSSRREVLTQIFAPNKEVSGAPPYVGKQKNAASTS